MKLLNLNAWQGRAPLYSKLIKDLLKVHHPDIVTLQEISETHGRGRISNLHNDHESMLADLRKWFGSEYCFYFSPRQSHFPAGEMTDQFDAFDFGNLIMWKHEQLTLMESRTKFLVGGHNMFDGKIPETMPVNIQSVLLKDKNSGKILNVINVHGYYAGKGIGKGDNAVRLKQSDDLVQLACEHDYDSPQIIVGDFNLRKNTISWRKILDNLEMSEVITENDIPTTRTSFYGLAKRKAEPHASYVFYSKDVNIANCIVYPEMEISDHAPIVIDFKV